MFYAINATVGLRVRVEEEIAGLDAEEHGSSAYPDLLLQADAPGSSTMPAGAVAQAG